MSKLPVKFLIALILVFSLSARAQNIHIPQDFNWTQIPPKYEGKTLVIKHPHKVNHAVINLPNKTTLLFNGGSISGFQAIYGENITIVAPANPVFDLQSNFYCSFLNTLARPEWFGASGNNKTNDAAAIQATINAFPKILFSARYYVAGTSITIRNACELVGEKNALIRGDKGNVCRFIVKNSLSVTNLTFSDFRFCFLVDHDQAIENIRFSNNLFSHIEKPIYASNSNLKQKLTHIEISDNTFQKCTAGVELLSWIQHLSLCNNHFADLGNPNLNAQSNAIRLGNTAFQYHSDTAMGDFTICGNTVKNVYCGLNQASLEGYECHAIFVLGNRIIIKENTIENVYNGGSRNNPRIKTGSEGIYAKANHCLIENNTLINAGFGEGAICVKGFNEGVRILNNTIRYTSDLADQSQLITCYFKGDLLISGNSLESVAPNSTGIKICNSDQYPSKATISDNKNWNVKGYALKILNRMPGATIHFNDNINIIVIGDIFKEESTQPYQLHFSNNTIEVKDGIFLPSSKMNQLYFNQNVVVARGIGKINNLYHKANIENNHFKVRSSFQNNPLFIAHPMSSYQNNKTTISGNWREEIMYIKD